jgi:hypothetical protein
VRRAASSVVSRTSPVFGVLNPVRPEPWLLHRIDSEVDAFTDRLEELVHGGLDALPDFDLNTGRTLLPMACVSSGARVA